MSFESQLTIIIIRYIAVSGLLGFALLSLFMKNRRWKLIFMFLTFLFVGTLSLVYYSDVLFFIVGITVVFFFLSLNLFVFQVRLFGNTEESERKGISKNSRAGTIFNILLPLLFCGIIGYLIYIYTHGFIQELAIVEDITIAGLSDITGLLLSDYRMILIFIIAMLVVSFFWFLIIGRDKK
jgi:hypothetical protein